MSSVVDILCAANQIYVWALHFFMHFSFLCYLDASLRSSILRDRLHFDVKVIERTRTV